ncbi:MAG: hypothetical protein IT162_08780 [Bryobacterales bacterium]|nr:hypothetical protein [Bryobacterales bacterium]
MHYRSYLPFLMLASTPAWALSTGPPQGRTAVPGEAGGATCTACHTNGPAVNSDTRGRLTIEARPYKPGVKQLIKVILEHPEGARWGFQLTVRSAANPLEMAGSLTPVAGSIRVRCGLTGTVDAPCANATDLQFASHVQASTFNGQRNRAEWEVEWTPPASGTGDIIIYAAGNAANSSGNNQGDIIYNTNRTIGVENCNLAKPTISGIANSATSPAGPLSANTLLSIYGGGFQATGSTRPVSSADISNNRFPTELSCIGVEIAGRRVPLTYAQENQINAQVPTVSDRGTVPVVVIANPGTPNERKSDPMNITLQATSPAFFRFGGNAIAATSSTGEYIANPTTLTGARGARAGETIALYATGLGLLDPVYQAGEIMEGAIRVKDAVTIEWGGTVLNAADVTYAGAVPGAISGLQQINVRVPATATPNSANVVRVRAGGVLSPEGTTIFVQ